MDIKKRRTDLDIAKGIGIILVVLAHAEMPFSQYITQFHMPFFFFISGMLFTAKDISLANYVKQKAKSLLFPFWLWNLLLYPFFFILYYWKNWSIKIFAMDLLEIVCTVDKVPFLGATWFLASLFWTAIIYKLIYSFVRRMKYSKGILLIISLISVCIGYNFTFPYRISRTLICSSFYILGFLYNDSNLSMKINVKIKYITSTIAIILYFAITYIFSALLDSNEYDNFILFYVAAVCAIYSLLNLCILLSKFKWKIFVDHLSYLGKNSRSIVVWQFLSFRVVIVIQIIFLKGNFRWLTDFPVHSENSVWWFFYTIVGLYVSIAVDKILGNIGNNLRGLS